MKLRKLFIVFIIIICMPFLFACAKRSKYFGTYVCASDPTSRIELLEFSIPERKGKAHFINARLSKYGKKKHSQRNVCVEVYRREGKVLVFRSVLDCQTISGTLDLETKTVNIDGCTYIKV